MPTLQASPFLERLLAFLIPYFLGFSADLAAARAEALETLASYGARTRAELICAVQIILFSFAALDTLAAANTPEMSPSMRLRFRGCANNLNRSSQKTEQALAKRLAAETPEATGTQADPINDLPDPEVEEMLQQTQAKIAAYRNQAAASRPVPAPTSASRPVQAPLSTSHPIHIPASVNHPVPNHSASNPPASNLPASTGRVQNPRAQEQPGPLTPKPLGQRAQNQSVLLTQEEQNKRLWGAAMMDTLAQMGMPAKPASGT